MPLPKDPDRAQLQVEVNFKPVFTISIPLLAANENDQTSEEPASPFTPWPRPDGGPDLPFEPTKIDYTENTSPVPQGHSETKSSKGLETSERLRGWPMRLDQLLSSTADRFAF